MNKPDSTAFGQWLDQAIRTRRMPNGKGYVTQQVVAAACGITQSHLSKIMSGTARPSADVVIRLANFLNENVNDLLVLASYEPIRDVAGLSAQDPLSHRMIAAVRALMRDKRKMAVAVAMIEAMLHESEHDDAAPTPASRQVPSQT